MDFEPVQQKNDYEQRYAASYCSEICYFKNQNFLDHWQKTRPDLYKDLVAKSHLAGHQPEDALDGPALEKRRQLLSTWRYR